MKQRGFTLLEMVIGITLLGLLLVLLYGGLRLGARGWDAGEASIEATSRQTAVTGFLRRQLAEVYPLTWRQDDGRDKVVFAGEAGAMHFAAPIPARLGPGGIHLLGLESAREDDKTVLKLRWSAVDPEVREFEFSDTEDQTRLVRGLESVEFAYFGAELEDEEPGWRDAWHSETRLPQLVRVRIKPAEGEAWPDILVEIRRAQPVNRPGSPAGGSA